MNSTMAAEAEHKDEAPACDGKCKCECPCKVLCEPFKNSELFGKLMKLFLWEKPVASAKALGVFTGLFVLFHCFDFTPYGLLFWAMLLGVLAALVYDVQRVINFFKDVDTPSRLPEKKCSVPDECIDDFFRLVADVVKAVLAFALDVVRVRSIPLSLSMVPLTIILIAIAGHMRFVTIVYVAILFSFVWFRLYKEKHDKIDELAAKLVAMIKEQIKNLKKKMNKPKSQ